MKVIALIDSFKGSMSSAVIANILKKELKSKGNTIEALPISDGGEGFIDAIKSHFLVAATTVKAVDPLGQSINCNYVVVDDVAYIEMNSAAGILLLKQSELNPLATTTYGVGVIIKDAINKGVKKIVLGIGGSATNDGGAGMLQALGVSFYSKRKLITKKMNGDLIGSVSTINISGLEEVIKGVEFQIVSDVKNALLGEDGCTYIYSTQKGATEKQIIVLEQNMKHYSEVVEDLFQKKFINVEGSGAAGGTGFGCLSFLNAHISSGIGFIIELLGIEQKIKESDVVIVGEGKLDNQSKNGKAPVGIAKIAKKYNKRVIGLFALVEDHVKQDLFDDVFAIVPKCATVKESIANPELYFIKMIKKIKL